MLKRLGRRRARRRPHLRRHQGRRCLKRRPRPRPDRPGRRRPDARPRARLHTKPASRPAPSATSRRTAPAPPWATSSRSRRSGRLFQDAGASPGDCVVGSVKSSIGHTKCAAGLAGLINASLSLYHNVLPPTIGIETPNPKLDLRDGPFRLCTEAQPWLHADPDRPRRAGVSAFGFGGTNFHAVLEAYDQNVASGPSACFRDWPAELLVWRAESAPSARRAARASSLSRSAAGRGPTSATCRTHSFEPGKTARPGPIQPATPDLALVATSHEDLQRETPARAEQPSPQGKSEPRRSPRPVLRGQPCLVGRTGGLSLPRPGRPVAGHASRAGRRLSRSSPGVRGVRPRARGRGVRSASGRSSFLRRRSAKPSAKTLAGA